LVASSVFSNFYSQWLKKNVTKNILLSIFNTYFKRKFWPSISSGRMSHTKTEPSVDLFETWEINHTPGIIDTQAPEKNIYVLNCGDQNVTIYPDM
jgi:hypothetical protein